MSQRFRKRRKFEAMLKSGLNKIKLQGIITEYVIGPISYLDAIYIRIRR